MGGVADPVQAQPAVGAGSHAYIVPAPPVDEVVPRARRLAPGVVGDLVGGEAGRGQHLLGGVEQLRRQVLPRRDQGSPGHGPVEGGAGLDRQLIGRDMFGPERDGLGEFGRPGLGGLAGKGVDQVQGQAWKRLRRQLRSPPRLGGVMVAAQEPERRVVQGLEAQGQPVHPGVGEAREPAGLGVGGIGLQGDLQIGGRGPEAARQGDDLAGPVRVHQRGRAAAEEDRDQGPVAGARRLGAQVGEDGVPEGQLLGAAAPVAIDVEVAIGADPRAIGPVDIEAQRRRGHGAAPISVTVHLIRARGADPGRAARGELSGLSPK